MRTISFGKPPAVAGYITPVDRFEAGVKLPAGAASLNAERPNADMVRMYKYELWNGREVVGYCLRPWRLNDYLEVFEVSPFKQLYGHKPKTIRFPLVTRTVSDDGVDIVTRRCLDVRRKSKRQISFLT